MSSNSLFISTRETSSSLISSSVFSSILFSFLIPEIIILSPTKKDTNNPEIIAIERPKIKEAHQDKPKSEATISTPLQISTIPILPMRA